MMRAGMRRNAPEPDEQEPMSWCGARAGHARGVRGLSAGPAVIALTLALREGPGSSS